MAAEQALLGEERYAPNAKHPIGWRGDGTGRFPGATPPDRFDIASGENISWAVTTPAYSNCQPIVVNDRVFITAEPDILLCYSLESGKELWRRDHRDIVKQPSEAQFPEWKQGLAQATPTSDGRYVVMQSGSGVIACYRLDGRRCWAKAIDYDGSCGNASSPIIIGRLVVMQRFLPGDGGWVDSRKGVRLFAYELQSGREVWQSQARGGGSIGCGSPTVSWIGKSPWLITAGPDLIDLRTGTVLSSLPLVGSGGSPAWLTNGPILHIAEAADGEKPGNRHELVRVDVTPGTGRRPPTFSVRWRTKMETHYPKVYKSYASPLVVDGVAYAMRVGGELLTFDYETGAFHHELPLAENNSDAYASPTLAGDAIWTIIACKDQTSRVTILQPGAVPKVLFTGTIPEPVRGSPFFQGSHVLIRSLGKLYCLRQAR